MLMIFVSSWRANYVYFSVISEMKARKGLALVDIVREITM